MNIFLFTRSFPYGSEETFLAYEIDVLSRVKQLNITLIPREISDLKRDVPDNVRVDTSYAFLVSKHSEKKIYPVLFKFLKIITALLQHEKFSKSAIRDVSSFVHYGHNMLSWAIKTLQGDELLYTYWNDVETFGLTLYKMKVKPETILISRTHGFDIYEENRAHGFIPFRKLVLDQINAVFCISSFGIEYFKRKYNYERSIKSYLGVRKPEVIPKDPQSTYIRIVSCSSLAKVKRLPLMISSIIHLAKENRERNFEWIHIGGDEQAIKKMINESISANLNLKFLGRLINEEVHNFYASHFVHVFFNLSTSEGIPVSMMEAMSYGIPVVGTAVGGVPEIVNESNGYLVRKDPTQEEVTQALMKVVSDQTKRKGAINTFRVKFNAETNFNQFADTIMTLKA